MVVESKTFNCYTVTTEVVHQATQDTYLHKSLDLHIMTKEFQGNKDLCLAPKMPPYMTCPCPVLLCRKPLP